MNTASWLNLLSCLCCLLFLAKKKRWSKPCLFLSNDFSYSLLTFLGSVFSRLASCPLRLISGFTFRNKALTLWIFWRSFIKLEMRIWFGKLAVTCPNCTSPRDTPRWRVWEEFKEERGLTRQRTTVGGGVGVTKLILSWYCQYLRVSSTFSGSGICVIWRPGFGIKNIECPPYAKKGGQKPSG